MERIRVLLVDRSAWFVSSARSFLSMNPDIEIVGHCSSARNALDQSRDLAPDLILMDLGLSHVSPFDLARQLKAINPHSRVVLLGLHDNEHYRNAAQDAGADAFLPKWDFACRIWSTIGPLFDGCLSTESREQRAPGANGKKARTCP